jgi:hypothetical protein
MYRVIYKGDKFLVLETKLQLDTVVILFFLLTHNHLILFIDFDNFSIVF